MVLYIESPKFCICYTLLVPPVLFGVGSCCIYLAIISTKISLILYLSFYAGLCIFLGVYMCLYTIKEYVWCQNGLFYGGPAVEENGI